MSESIENQAVGERRDGIRITLGSTGTFIIKHPSGRSIELCPCCNNPFLSFRAAARTADIVWPPPGNAA